MSNNPSEFKTDNVLVVRFHIQDNDAFKSALGDQMFNSMVRDQMIDGALVTAISRKDIFEELEALEERHAD